MQTRGVRTNLVGRIDLSAYAVADERRALVGHRSGRLGVSSEWAWGVPRGGGYMPRGGGYMPRGSRCCHVAAVGPSGAPFTALCFYVLPSFLPSLPGWCRHADLRIKFPPGL